MVDLLPLLRLYWRYLSLLGLSSSGPPLPSRPPSWLCHVKIIWRQKLNSGPSFPRHYAQTTYPDLENFRARRGGGGIILPVLYNLHSLQKVIYRRKGRRLGDRFREPLRDVEKDDKNASKPVVRHFNLPNHSMQHMAVCGLSLHQGNTESRKPLEQFFFSNRHS